MIGIENFPNILPADADYLNGDIKDTPSGTPVSRLTNGDIQQFFRKLMRDAGITPNGLRDNETNGFQSIEALRIACKTYNVYTVRLTQSGTNAPVEAVNHNDEIGGPIVWSRSGVGTYAGTLVGAFLLNKVFALSLSTTLGVGEVKVSRFDDDNLVMFVYDTAGVVTDNWTADIEIRVYR